MVKNILWIFYCVCRDKKNKTIFWTVSHCLTDNLREKYVDQLRNYIEVDIFGECSGIECPRGMKDSCFANQGIHYWFYLAFENSNCPDYITEKLWRILDLPVVPIVMGGGNYRRDAPPHSVIDVNDFPHVKGLASYLNFLMKNPVRFIFPR